MKLEERKKKLGKLIKGLREDADITQRIVAYKSNISLTYMSDIERGKRCPSFFIVSDIIKAINSLREKNEK